MLCLYLTVHENDVAHSEHVQFLVSDSESISSQTFITGRKVSVSIKGRVERRTERMPDAPLVINIFVISDIERCGNNQ